MDQLARLSALRDEVKPAARDHRVAVQPQNISGDRIAMVMIEEKPAVQLARLQFGLNGFNVGHTWSLGRRLAVLARSDLSSGYRRLQISRQHNSASGPPLWKLFRRLMGSKVSNGESKRLRREWEAKRHCQRVEVVGRRC